MLHAKNPRPLRSKRRKASNRHPSWSVSSIKTDEAIHRAFLEKLDTPTSLGVWLRFKYGEHAQLIAVKVDQANYLTTAVDKFRRDYAATKYFSKAKGLKTGVNLKEVALDSARTAEAICRETNNKIKSFRNGSVRNPVDSEWFRARQIIASILGPLPRKFNPEGWSPGRTSSAYGDKLSSTHKFASQLDVTWSAQLHALREVRQSPSWSASVLDADGPCSILRSGLNVVRGNVMITVPKSAKTDRVICYEPHANIWLQLSVGSFLKHRLMKFGVNLEDQSINQRKALRGSLTRLLATIDLSMASDTLALELVYELLPIDWALYLDELRSKETLWPDGVWRTNEKFSSMGNGFTFELESLIFYALCCAVANNVSVFGDDIIVPTESFERVKHVLENSGFVLNSAKSFAEGNFRESCGMDAFCGVDCTPVYVRDFPKRFPMFGSCITGSAPSSVERSLPLSAGQRCYATSDTCSLIVLALRATAMDITIPTLSKQRPFSREKGNVTPAGKVGCLKRWFRFTGYHRFMGTRSSVVSLESFRMRCYAPLRAHGGREMPLIRYQIVDW